MLAFELIEGRLPFHAPVVQQMLSMHLNDPIPPMKSGRAPEAVEEMIYRLLAKKPQHRLQSPAEILETLRPYVAFEPSQELSMASLDRYKREAVQADGPGPSAVSVPVTEPYAETLADYEQADTPLPVDDEDTRQTIALDASDDGLSRASAFGTMVAPLDAEKAPREDVDDAAARGAARPPQRRLLEAGLLAVMLAVGVVTWHVLSAPEPPPAKPADAARPVADDAPSQTLANTAAPESPAPDEADDSKPNPAQAQTDQADAGAPQAQDDDVAKKDAPSHTRQRRHQRPAKHRAPAHKAGTKEYQRPRKLELTY